MNKNIFGPSWIPKVGGLLSILGIALRKHHSPDLAFWGDPLMAIGAYLIGWFSRQNGVSSEQVAAAKVSTGPSLGLVLMLATLLLVPGCTAPILPGNDPVVVRAEQARTVAADTFSAFVRLEYLNRPSLQAISPDFARIADQVRSKSDGWIQSLTRVLASYKSNRTPDNRASLTAGLSTLDAALREVELHTAIATQHKITP